MLFDFKTYIGRQIFYNSKIWKDTREYKLSQNPLCEECLKKGIFTPGCDVHHKTDIAKCPTFENATDINGLLTLCKKCHSYITAQEQGFGKKFESVPYNAKTYLF